MHRSLDLLVFIFELNDFGIDEQAKPIGSQRLGEEVFGFLV